MNLTAFPQTCQWRALPTCFLAVGLLINLKDTSSAWACLHKEMFRKWALARSSEVAVLSPLRLPVSLLLLRAPQALFLHLDEFGQAISWRPHIGEHLPSIGQTKHEEEQ